MGTTRVIARVVMAENTDNVRDLVKKYIAPQSVIQTDSGNAYRFLDASTIYAHKSVNHSVEYCAGDGTNNNQAECFISRIRRAEFGVYNGMRDPYFSFFVAEFSWRQNMNKKTMLYKFNDLIIKVFQCGLSKAWRGYYQGHRLPKEYLN